MKRRWLTRSTRDRSRWATMAASAERHQQVHDGFGDGAGGPGLMGVGRQLPARRPVAFFVAAFPRSKSTSRPVNTHIDYLAVADVGTVLHHNLGGQTSGRRCWASVCDRPEVGVRPALRRRAGQAIPLQPAPDDSRRAGAHAVGLGGSARSGNARRRARHRRTAGRRRLLCRPERHQRCAWRRNLPACPGNTRHDSDCA